MSDINVTVQDEIVNIDVIDEPVLVNVVNSPGQQGPAGPGVPVGGTAGQILAKASATDYDTEWINNYAKYLATNVRNQTGSTIGAFQVVYISGATGNKPLISLADADTEATSSKTYGVTATSIANNGTGDVVTAGELSGIDTSAFNEGDLLWLSTTAGGVVTTPPAEPAHAVFIGYVVRSHPTLGTIDVSIQNGYELNELHGVQITSAANNDGLFYNSTSTLWENKSITTALGFTPVPTTRNITINGVTYDLSADRTWTISTGISGSGAAGQVTYWTGASAVSGSNNLFWDNANGRLGIGTNVPTQRLTVINSTGTNVANFRGSASSYILVGDTSLAGESGINMINSSAQAFFGISGTQCFIAGASGADVIRFTLGGSERMRISPNFNLLINSTTDSGERLQVTGNVKVVGSGNTNGTLGLVVQNSDSSNLLRVFNGGSIGIGNAADRPLILPFTTSAGSSNLTGTNLSFFSGTGTQAATQGIFAFENTAAAQTSGNNYFIRGLSNYRPTSGTGTFAFLRFEGIINQTGGANGITRGLWIDPTLTAAADWRSIEWSNNSGWGLYGAGTANNYLAGSLGIGTTSLTSRKIAIGGNTVGSGFNYGINTNVVIQSDVTNYLGYNSEPSTQATTFTLNNLRHFSAIQGTFGASSSVTNQMGFWAHSTMIGATNNYGFYGDIASGTGRWNLYMAGTANNYLAGSLGIGTTSLTGRGLYVSQNATGSSGSAWIISAESSIQSDVTNSAVYFQTFSRTQAATFTLSNLRHFNAQQGTFGASSTITNQFGFNVSNSLIGATNNYGFYGDIAGGTGRWNLYMNGTADNYLAGNLGIGITPTVRLHVSGDTILRGSGATSATTALTVQNSSSTNLFRVFNDGTATLQGNFTINNGTFYFINQYTANGDFFISASGSTNVLFTNGVSNNFGRLQLGGTSASYPSIKRASNNIEIKNADDTFGAGLSVGASLNASAILQADSTTKGFLPPRMTTTQKNAIATPAAGLVVYDTTDNKHYGYDGTTWNAFY